MTKVIDLNFLNGNRKKYIISIDGCHDITYCELELSDNEIEIFKNICNKINKCSKYQCQPTIEIHRVSDEKLKGDDNNE